MEHIVLPHLGMLCRCSHTARPNPGIGTPNTSPPAWLPRLLSTYLWVHTRGSAWPRTPPKPCMSALSAVLAEFTYSLAGDRAKVLLPLHPSPRLKASTYEKTSSSMVCRTDQIERVSANDHPPPRLPRFSLKDRQRVGNLPFTCAPFTVEFVRPRILLKG